MERETDSRGEDIPLLVGVGGGDMHLLRGGGRGGKGGRQKRGRQTSASAGARVP